MFGVKPSESNAPLHIINGGMDYDYLWRFREAHKDSDFDSDLVCYTFAVADGLHVAQAAPSQAPRGPSPAGALCLVLRAPAAPDWRVE